MLADSFTRYARQTLRQWRAENLRINIQDANRWGNTIFVSAAKEGQKVNDASWPVSVLELGHAFIALCALAMEKVTILGNISVGKVGGLTNFAM